MAKGTVLVNLRKDWFGPDGSLYQVRDNPHEFPAEFADDPEQLEDESKEDFAARKKRQPFNVLPSTAKIVENAKTVAVIQNTGGGERVIVPTAVEGDVKSVGGALDDNGNEKATQTIAKAEAGAKELEVEVGGKPRESGPLPAGTKKPA